MLGRPAASDGRSAGDRCEFWSGASAEMRGETMVKPFVIVEGQRWTLPRACDRLGCAAIHGLAAPLPEIAADEDQCRDRVHAR